MLRLGRGIFAKLQGAKLLGACSQLPSLSLVAHGNSSDGSRGYYFFATGAVAAAASLITGSTVLAKVRVFHHHSFHHIDVLSPPVFRFY